MPENLIDETYLHLLLWSLTLTTWSRHAMGFLRCLGSIYTFQLLWVQVLSMENLIYVTWESVVNADGSGHSQHGCKDKVVPSAQNCLICGMGSGHVWWYVWLRGYWYVMMKTRRVIRDEIMKAWLFYHRGFITPPQRKSFFVYYVWSRWLMNWPAGC